MVNLILSSIIGSAVSYIVLGVIVLAIVRVMLKSRAGQIILLSCCMMGIGAGGAILYKDNEIVAIQAQQQAEIERLANEYRDALAKETKRLEKQKEDAISKAEQDAKRSRASAAAARAELARLRRTMSDVEARIRVASESAVREYASAVGTVFEQCSEQLVAMARISDGHANDVKLLIAAWPRRREDED